LEVKTPCPQEVPWGVLIRWTNEHPESRAINNSQPATSLMDILLFIISPHISQSVQGYSDSTRNPQDKRLMVMRMFTALGSWVYIAFGIFLKILFTSWRAEIVGLSLVGRFILGCFRVYHHPTYWIFFHTTHLLSG
jgi:hypothetical protein